MRKDLRHIQDHKLFVGSGVEGVYDKGLITTLDEFGQYHAKYSDARKNDIGKIVYNSDQSKNEDDIAETLFSNIPNIKYNNTIGYYLDLYVGHVVKGDFRKNGSSGGFVTWLASKMLENGMINGFIHVRKSDKPGLLFEYKISRTVKEIKLGAKSRYYPVELSESLKEIKKNPGAYAVVGIPEIITELRLLAENDKIIGKRIKYFFGLVAGHQKTTKYAEAIGWEYGIKPGDLTDIDFRVKKKTGTAIEYDMKFTGRVEGKDRTFIVRNEDSFVSCWAHGFFKARFSDFTDNSFNEVADVTFGDAWLNNYVGDPEGNNILIVRNPELLELIKKANSLKELKVDSVDEKTIISSQQGLIHHTRDELPYRLIKEIKNHGWAPRKRVAPDNGLNKNRKKVQDIRQNIAEKSHIYYKEAVERNDFNYFKEKMQPHLNRYKKLYNQQVASKKARVRIDGAILTLTGYFNYGNVVQRYALQKFLRIKGYNYVSYVNSHHGRGSVYKISKKSIIKTPLRFIKRLIGGQKPYWYIPSMGDFYPEMKKNENLISFVNKNIKIKEFHPDDNFRSYIVGSDQIWRNWFNNREILGYYFLSFLRGKEVNRVAYAASFGKDRMLDVMSKNDIEYVMPYVQQFSAISVREKSGVELINKTWGIKGVKTVVDPTLLLDKEDYSELIEKTDVKYQKIQPIFAYIIEETPEILKFILDIRDARRQRLTKICIHDDTKMPPVEMWLKGFRDAGLVLTNSFHGMMFSILNNTDFLIISKQSGGLARVKDFLDEYKIKGRLIDENKLADFNLDKLEPIDWDAVNNKISQDRKRSGEWLIAAINK